MLAHLWLARLARILAYLASPRDLIRAPIYQPHHGTVTPFSGSGSDVLQVARKKVYATERFWRGFVVDKVNGDTA